MATAPPRGFGVSLAGFDAAIAAFGGRATLADKTTAWVKENLVLPATRDTCVPYVNVLLALGGIAFVGEATAFLSHAYAYPFLAVVDAVNAWEARQPQSTQTHYYYFDLFVVNQHSQSMGVRPEILWAEFCGNVKRIGRTLLVCMWRTTVLPFTRIWCLAEIATALDGCEEGGSAAASLTLVMPHDEELAFRASLAHSFDDLVRKSCTIDLAAAKAYHCDYCLITDESGSPICRHVASTGADHIDECPKDCAFVRRQIRDGMGFDVANERIAAAVREWMAEAGRLALEALPPGPERSTSELASGYARLLNDQGRIDEAAALFREVLDARQSALGLDDPRTLSALYDYGFMLSYQAHNGLAEALLREALTAQRAKLHDDHADTLRSALALARCLHDQCRYEEADRLFSEVVSGRSRTLGRDAPETLEALKHHGVLLEKWGKLAAAGACLREALDGQRRTLGEFHPQTLSTTHKYATLLMAEGRTEEAAPLYHAAHAGRRRVLGDAHPHTLWSIVKVAGLQRMEGRLEAAAALYREAADGFQRAFGSAHPATVDAQHSCEAVSAALAARTGLSLSEGQSGRKGAGESENDASDGAR